MHTRIQIRKAVLKLLQSHQGFSELCKSRGKPTDEGNLPFANVMTGVEIALDFTDQWREQRTLQVSVLLYQRDDEDVADALDDLAEKAEALLRRDQTLGGICESFRYKGATPDYESGAAQEIAALVLNYECVYIWEPVVDLEALTAIAVDIDMAGPRLEPQLPAHPDGQIDAVDVINLP